MEIKRQLENILFIIDYEKEFSTKLSGEILKIFQKYLFACETALKKITVTKDFYPNARKQFEELKTLVHQLLLCERAVIKVI